MPGHDNILHFVDAWEEDSVLFIRTEMCSLGNLDIFLLEWWGTVRRLDEGRLWKIMSELVNVSISPSQRPSFNLSLYS